MLFGSPSFLRQYKQTNVIVMEESLLKPRFHEGDKVRSYSIDLKLEILCYAEANCIHAASKTYTKLIDTVFETGRGGKE